MVAEKTWKREEEESKNININRDEGISD